MDVVDVRINRIDYAETITESVYRRMEAERQQVANQLRSTGAADGEEIRAAADRQREVTLANAYREAQKVKGNGDAEAARVYAEAFGKDPAFAQFYRSLEAYKASFATKSDVMVVDPSSDFFKAMRSSAVGGTSGK
jgi:membrane protease subunit HflC